MGHLMNFIDTNYPTVVNERCGLHVHTSFKRDLDYARLINEEFFNGHFPNKPVMPGVMTIEALAQTSALLAFLTMGQKPDENAVVYFLGIDNARFKRPVGPGDQLILDVDLLRVKSRVYKYAARASVDGEGAVEAELTCTVRRVA